MTSDSLKNRKRTLASPSRRANEMARRDLRCRLSGEPLQIAHELPQLQSAGRKRGRRETASHERDD